MPTVLLPKIKKLVLNLCNIQIIHRNFIDLV